MSRLSRKGIWRFWGQSLMATGITLPSFLFIRVFTLSLAVRRRFLFRCVVLLSIRPIYCLSHPTILRRRFSNAIYRITSGLRMGSALSTNFGCICVMELGLSAIWKDHFVLGRDVVSLVD